MAGSRKILKTKPGHVKGNVATSAVSSKINLGTEPTPPEDDHPNFNDSSQTIIPIGYEGKIKIVEKRSQEDIPDEQLLNSRRPPAHRDDSMERKFSSRRQASSDNDVDGGESDPTLFLKSICIPGGHRANIYLTREDMIFI